MPVALLFKLLREKLQASHELFKSRLRVPRNTSTSLGYVIPDRKIFKFHSCRHKVLMRRLAAEIRLGMCVENESSSA